MLYSFQSTKATYLKVNGGDEEDRTPDPLRARQVLSQLSYTPKLSFQQLDILLSYAKFVNIEFLYFYKKIKTLKIKQ